MSETKKINVKKTALITGGIIIGSFILAITFLYMKSYDIQYELNTFSQFWEENNLLEQFSAEGNSIDMVIPENVINTELMMWMKKMPIPSRYKVKNIQLDSAERRINMNGSIYGINMPLSMNFEPTMQDGKIVVNFDKIIIGKSIKVNESSSNKLMSFLFENNLPIVLSANDLFHCDMVIINNLEWKEDKFHLSIQLNEKLLRAELSQIKSHANEELLSRFENSSNEAEKTAAQYLNNLDKLNNQDIEHLIKDILSSGEITCNLLIIAEPATSQKIFEVYGKNLIGIDTNQIAEKRIKILFEQLKPYNTAIYEALNTIYFAQEPMHINKGQLYSVYKHEYITPQILARDESVIISEKTLSRLSFYYDKENAVLLVAYKLDDTKYLIMNQEAYRTLSSSIYEEGLLFENSGRVSHVNDLTTYNSLLNEVKTFYQEEEVYIRYMKADDRYAFVVASPKYNYQSYKAMAFEKKDQKWTILEEDVQSISVLNREHPDFNLETATMDIEKVNIYQLGEDMFEVILEDMIDKGVIKSKKDLSITYCSYGNDYIAFLLSDGKEYVYKVYSMYLHTVYDKETAEKTWGDLPEIITLQNPPKE